MAEIICPQCNLPNRGTAQFCSECGAPLLSNLSPREAAPATIPRPKEDIQPEELEKQSETILQNRYRIEESLGQGGFGSVYRAWDLNLNRVCAIKENLAVSPDAQRQFMREATVLANLSHPNLPRVIDHFIIPDRGQYLVMDYVAGEDLESLLAREEIVAVPTAIKWILQVADGLQYLHSQKPPVFHRDVKPANIRITPNDQAMLVDFGLVKVLDSHVLTTQGARAITPGYAPPEQYGRGGTDARTDIYALGATLYILVTGHEPLESVRRLAGEYMPSAHLANPNVTKPLSDAIERAMELDPTNRYQSIAEFRLALQTAQSAATILIDKGSETMPVVGHEALTIKPSMPPIDLTQKVPEIFPGTTPSEPPSSVVVEPAVQTAKRRPKWLGLAVGGALGLAICLGLSIGLASYFFQWGGDPVQQTLTAHALLNVPVQATLTARVRATSSGIVETRSDPTTVLLSTEPAKTEGAPTEAATASETEMIAPTSPIGEEATEQARSNYLSELKEKASLAYGPRSGRILHKAENGYIETISASIGARNFITEVTFFSPYPPDEGEWDFGIMFRQGDANVQYRLVFLSDKSWILTSHIGSANGKTIAEGMLEGMKVGNGESNSIRLFAIENNGYLFFNDNFIAEFDLSQQYSGGIVLGIGFYKGTEKTGKLTEYKDFTIWTLPTQP